MPTEGLHSHTVAPHILLQWQRNQRKTKQNNKQIETVNVSCIETAEMATKTKINCVRPMICGARERRQGRGARENRAKNKIINRI